MQYSRILGMVVTTLFGRALHAILMRSIDYAKYGQENGPFEPAPVELELNQREDGFLLDVLQHSNHDVSPLCQDSCRPLGVGF